MNLNLAGIIEESVVDGPGLRFVIFTQGCPHNCDGCHNQKSIPFEGGEVTDIDEIFEKIKKNPLISGVTFSGGEPFCQAAPLVALAKKIKTLKLEIAVYTGFLFEQLLAKNDADITELLQNVDTVIDGRFEKDLRDWQLKFKGSRNQRVIDVKKSLAAGQVVPDTATRWN